MIKFEHVEVTGWKAAIRGMRNPKESWDRGSGNVLRGGVNGSSNNHADEETTS